MEKYRKERCACCGKVWFVSREAVVWERYLCPRCTKEQRDEKIRNCVKEGGSVCWSG